MIYCHDINGVFKRQTQDQIPTESTVFIDYSQGRPKAVLLHNEIFEPSIPIAHSVHLKETYDEMKILLEGTEYNVQHWGICGDLKMTGMLKGMQERFTKFCCF